MGLIEDNSSDLYPFALWIDKEQAQSNGDLKTFLLEHEAEYKLLMDGEIDYIVIEYDM